ncbi:MAG: 50S ribosomal protein L25/general stress protein Ctc, partial [Proteobacteria bacterium]|nr:50S ribosomal protein L25/general stress protein Ctc [Pseudomonadota bacterium]
MQAVSKDKQGKGSARALRNAGMVPAVIYAPGEAAMSVAVNAKDLAKCLQIGRFFTSTQELALPKGAMKVLARDIQRHPLTDMPIHVDFMKYNAASKVHVNVTVVITGEKTSPGMKEGGVIQLIESTIEVVCRADSIPQEIVVDISKLGIGDSIHLSEITLPAGVKSAVVDRDLTIVSVVSTRTSATAEDEAA